MSDEPTYPYLVERDVPMPPAPANSAKYPWRKMSMGDSFFVPDTDYSDPRVVRSAMSWAGSRSGRKFSVRVVKGGLRVWRIG